MKILAPVFFMFILAGCQPNSAEQENRQQPQAENKNTQQAEVENIDYLTLGQQHAQKAQSVLGGNLKQAMQEQGPIGALNFCHEQAIPLTDSVVAGDLVDLKRVSDKNRNPDNVANAAQLAYIDQAKQQLANGQMPEGKVGELNNQMVAYYPIVTQAGCLKCHGLPETDIAPETMAALNQLYPEDKATGFDVDQLRGIWVVTMAKQGNQNK